MCVCVCVYACQCLCVCGMCGVSVCVCGVVCVCMHVCVCVVLCACVCLAVSGEAGKTNRHQKWVSPFSSKSPSDQRSRHVRILKAHPHQRRIDEFVPN